MSYKIDTYGTHALSVVVNEDTSNQKTSEISVSQNEPDAASSQIVFVNSVQLESDNTVSAYIYDAFGNAITDTQSLLLQVSGQGQDIFATMVQQASLEAYQTQYSIPTGDSDISMCG